jgi:citrate lyase subunit beta/citryl-CoA lyase
MIAAALPQEDFGPRRYVRVNALSTPWLQPDLEAVIVPGIEGICLTKVVRPQDILETASLIEGLEKKRGLEIGKVRILAAVESARGLMNALAIADAHQCGGGGQRSQHRRRLSQSRRS